MKVMILCGGQGTRLREHTEVLPKPMVEIGGRPILWHIMKLYAFHGFTEFILCLGYKGHVIRNYFLNYEAMNSDVTLALGQKHSMEFHGDSHSETGWKVTLVDTGEHTMTGARIRKGARYLDGGTFAVTYGDGVCNADMRRVLEFHRSHGHLATLTGVRSPSLFGELHVQATLVQSFSEKPALTDRQINGGFFFFEPGFLDYLEPGDDCVLERSPLERCARDCQLHVYEHTGFWQCMDTYRDWLDLERKWTEGNAPWKVW